MTGGLLPLSSPQKTHRTEYLAGSGLSSLAHWPVWESDRIQPTTRRVRSATWVARVTLRIRTSVKLHPDQGLEDSCLEGRVFPPPAAESLARPLGPFR